MDRRSDRRQRHLVAILWAVIVCTGYDVSGLHRAVPSIVSHAEASCR